MCDHANVFWVQNTTVKVVFCTQNEAYRWSVPLPPHAPWEHSGEFVAALVWSRAAKRAALPDGLRPMRGPVVAVAARFAESPVGPYVELAVGQPARLGLRPGLCIKTMVVTSVDSRVGGVVNWGFPKELGTLEWASLPDAHGTVELRWRERGLVLFGRPATRRALPGLFPVRSVQRRADGPVVVPGHVRGWARPARVAIALDDADDPLAGLVGAHWGLHVAGLRFVVDAARHPSGLTATLRAPLRAPEPALRAPGVAARAAGNVSAPAGV